MEFSLTVLGSSSALPTATRHPSAHVLNVNDKYYLIDCGEGTQMQLRKYRFRFQRIDHIFISHLHGDHYFGLIGLLTSMILLGRDKPLNIYAPEGLRELIEMQLVGIPEDQRIEIIYHHLNFKEPEEILSDKRISVHSFPVKHRIPCCGFLFREQPRLRNLRKPAIVAYSIPLDKIPGIKAGEDFVTPDGEQIENSRLTIEPPQPRSFAYSADTCYWQKLAATFRGVDLLYHEATFADDMLNRAKKTGHTTARQAATLAQEAQVGQLVLGHFSARYKSLNALESEAREVFPEAQLAEEGKTYQVPIKKK